MNIVFGALSPQDPAVNAHYGIVYIDHAVSQQPEVKENVYINKCRDNSGRVDPDVFFNGKIHTQNTEHGSGRLKHDLCGTVGFVGFYEEII
jgi:hypothetical protein